MHDRHKVKQFLWLNFSFLFLAFIFLADYSMGWQLDLAKVILGIVMSLDIGALIALWITKDSTL